MNIHFSNSQFSILTYHGNVIMKKLSGPQATERGRVSDLRQKNPALRETGGTSVQYSDYSDDLTLNDADIVELDSKSIVRQDDEKADISDYADDLTLNDADITDLEKQKLPRAESLDDLTDYADDLTLNDADIVEIDSKNILMPRDEKAYITDYADDLTLNDADIRDLTAQSGLLRSLGAGSDDLMPDYPPDIKHPRTHDYTDDLSLNNADIRDIAATGPIPVRRPEDRSNDLRANHPGILEIDDSPLAGDAAAFEDYTDDLSLNNADIRDLTALSGPPDSHIVDIIDTDGTDILSDLPAEIIELMCYTENDKAETRDYENLMPEIIREAMGLAEDKNTDEESLSGIAENVLSDTYNPLLCPADKTDFLKEQNDLIELTDISTDFIDDNEDTVVNFEKREPKESNDIIDLTDIALPLPDDNEDTVDLEEKDEIQTVADPDAGAAGHEDAAALDGNNLFLSESTEESSALTGDFNEFSGYSDDDGESDLSEDIEAVADLINIVVRFPDDDTESAGDGDKKKKDLLALLEKEISEDTDIAEDYAEYEEALGKSGEEETDAEYENDRIEVPSAEDEISERCDTADTGAEKVSEKNSLNVTDFYSLEETDIAMEKDLIDLLEMEPSETVSENMPEFQELSDSSPVFIKNDAEIQDQPRSDTVPEQITEPQKIPGKSSDTLAEYLEDIVKDIICEKIDQMVLDQQRIVDVIEKAVLKEKNKLIRDLTADG